jgi:hypothetical protein
MDPIEPKNLTARLAYRGRGNPPNSHPQDAIGNCFPGLEVDLRTLLRNLFVGIVLHEGTGVVIGVHPNGPAANAGLTPQHLLFAINDVHLRGDNFNPIDISLDWGNILADFLVNMGKQVKCTFYSLQDKSLLDVTLQMQQLLEGATITRAVAAPGDLTQSLCSPWQSDFHECSCDYWAANRPDFIAVETVDGQAQGFNWLHKDRSSAANKQYVTDPPNGALPNPLMTFDDLYREWETLLRFQIGGKDETEI